MTERSEEYPRSEEYSDLLTEAMRRGSARTMALLAQAAETAVLVAAIRERQAARRAIEEAQRERAQAAAEEMRRQTDRVRWQRALDDEWLESATVDELVTAWVAGRAHVHEDAMAHDAVGRLESTLYAREPEAMDLYQRLMHAPYEPEEAMRQAAEWFTRARDADAIRKKSPYERTARVARGELDPGPAVVAAHQREDLRQAVTLALPDLADQITGDDAWPALAATMSTAEQQGLDPAEVLARVAAERELNTARGMTAVLQWRLERYLENPPPSPTDAPTGTPTAGDGATASPPTTTATAGSSRQDEVRRAIRDVGRSRRMTNEDGSDEERRAFILERWRTVHAVEDEHPGAQRAARAFERELIALDPEARALYESLAPSHADGSELTPAEREQERLAAQAAFAGYLDRHGLTPEGKPPVAPHAEAAPPQQPAEAPGHEDQTVRRVAEAKAAAEKARNTAEKLNASARVGEGTVLYQWTIDIPAEDGSAAFIASGQFRVPAGPDQQAAAERAAADELHALFRTEAERERPVPDDRQRDYVIRATGPGGPRETIRVTGRTMRARADDMDRPASTAERPAPATAQAAPTAQADQAPAGDANLDMGYDENDLDRPAPAQPQASAQTIPPDVQAAAQTAVRMTRMASPGPVDAALGQQKKTERPAVSGKVVLGRERTNQRKGPRPGH
ncbi:hypothetical protein [Streptomyces sp. NPDC001492]